MGLSVSTNKQYIDDLHMDNPYYRKKYDKEITGLHTPNEFADCITNEKSKDTVWKNGSAENNP